MIKFCFFFTKLPTIFVFVEKLLPNQKVHTATRQNGLFPSFRFNFDLLSEDVHILGSAQSIGNPSSYPAHFRMSDLVMNEPCDFDFSRFVGSRVSSKLGGACGP